MAELDIYCWMVGQTADGEPLLEKCLLDEPPGEGAFHAQQDAQAWAEEIVDELDDLDRKSIRALREGDAARVAQIEARAEALRRRLRACQAALRG